MELAGYFGRGEVRGECVIVVAACEGEGGEGGEMAVERMVEVVERVGGLPHAKAARVVAALTGVSRREVYARSLRAQEGRGDE
ncbi:MAG: hypothetical protein N2595_10945 [bacterium]|nr:hypothetical protein [bacterium]